MTGQPSGPYTMYMYNDGRVIKDVSQILVEFVYPIEKEIRIQNISFTICMGMDFTFVIFT